MHNSIEYKTLFLYENAKDSNMIRIRKWIIPFVSSDSLYGLMSDDPELLLSTGRWFSFKEPSEDPTDPTVSDKWRSRYEIHIHFSSVQS